MRERKYGWADKAALYKQWRYDWNHGAVHDVDQVEWRDNKPLCVLELTSHGELHDDTKKSVAGRLWNSFSGRKLRHLAGRMNVPFFVVLIRTRHDGAGRMPPDRRGCLMVRSIAWAISAVALLAAAYAVCRRYRRHPEQPYGVC
jgi:hypothetical protein